MATAHQLTTRLNRRKHAIMAAWEHALRGYQRPWRACPVLRVNVVPPLFDEIIAAINTHAETRGFDKNRLRLAAEHGRLRALTKGYGPHNVREEYALLLRALDALLAQDGPLSDADHSLIRTAVFRAQRRALARYNHVHHARRALRKRGWRIKLAQAKQNGQHLDLNREAYLLRQIKLQRRLIGLMQTHSLSGNAHIPWEEIYQIVDHVPHPIFTVDAGGAVNFFNARWYSYTGLTPAQSLDHGWMTALHPRVRKSVENRFAKICSSDQDREFECELRDATGQFRWHLMRMWSVVIPTDRTTPIAWLVMVHDIHKEKLTTKHVLEEIGRIQAAHAQAQADVTALEREADMRERFVALLGHDLRNPLNVAQTCCARLIRQPNRTPEQREHIVNRIMTALERTDRMIGNLLDAYRLQRGGTIPVYPEPADLRQIVADSIAHLLDDDSARFVLETQQDVVEGTWDPVNLGRVFDNLCTNAIKYGAIDTPVTIRITATPDAVSAAIHNFGDPIPKALQDKIFSPFERAQADNPSLAGWGLGLVLVRGIVEAHHGTVCVESSQAEGTCFTVRLPRHPPTPADAPVTLTAGKR